MLEFKLNNDAMHRITAGGRDSVDLDDNVMDRESMPKVPVHLKVDMDSKLDQLRS